MCRLHFKLNSHNFDYILDYEELNKSISLTQQNVAPMMGIRSVSFDTKEWHTKKNQRVFAAAFYMDFVCFFPEYCMILANSKNIHVKWFWSLRKANKKGWICFFILHTFQLTSVNESISRFLLLTLFVGERLAAEEIVDSSEYWNIVYSDLRLSDDTN